MPSGSPVPVRIALHSLRPRLEGFRHFWMKRVDGFDPSKHCMACLKGPREDRVGRDIEPSTWHALEGYREGDVVYLCGVAWPWSWENNFHLVGRVKAGARAEAATWLGDTVEFDGVERISIDAQPASLAFPGRSAAYLTCRNFQLGAQLFATNEKPAGVAGGFVCEAA